jgi:hypothetical protein
MECDDHGADLAILPEHRNHLHSVAFWPDYLGRGRSVVRLSGSAWSEVFRFNTNMLARALASCPTRGTTAPSLVRPKAFATGGIQHTCTGRPGSCKCTPGRVLVANLIPRGSRSETLSRSVWPVAFPCIGFGSTFSTAPGLSPRRPLRARLPSRDRTAIVDHFEQSGESLRPDGRRSGPPRFSPQPTSLPR